MAESVWDYPRPPRVEPDHRLVTIELGGATIVETTDAVRVLETSHPPTFYLPIEAFQPGSLRPAEGTSVCEYKGLASYWDVLGGDATAPKAAWGYRRPNPGFEALTGRVAVYAGPMDRCTVGGVVVEPQAGGFYGGWITPDVVGPFKGAPGTRGW